ncbi:hypothetical protein [Desulfobacter hydrogenophilus]|uniref:Uncharacterized protein n=1 Tax=Desulfobacter hydrogenophilus TaxID=2291 RepID=A0ABX5RCB6_9BACT|nr:hypothetical protein [Desulfobacter hydrogenophilus]NDY73216.1 hypothetical protein [Desulfobacter hydrogenophilus]QBH12532.1 hypothetical protein EYB58_06150 [Desulfobacter hydrogenophilus]
MDCFVDLGLLFEDLFSQVRDLGILKFCLGLSRCDNRIILPGDLCGTVGIGLDQAGEKLS